MNIIECIEHDKLIPFYIRRGIELIDKFENEPFLSYVIEDNENIVAAITCSKVDNTYVIEAIAVDEKYERNYIGTKLLNFMIEKLNFREEKNIILNAKKTIFFEKSGFVVIGRDEVPVDAYSYCFECLDYNVNCFPKIMKFVGKK